METFSFEGLLNDILLFSNFYKTFCNQAMEILIIRGILQCLIWVCTVCLCPTKWTLGLFKQIIQQISNSCDMRCPFYSYNKWVRETVDDEPQNWPSWIAHDPPTSLLCIQSIRCKKNGYIQRGIISITHTAHNLLRNFSLQKSISQNVSPYPHPPPPPLQKKVNTEYQIKIM